jgi:hypothetical protein
MLRRRFSSVIFYETSFRSRAGSSRARFNLQQEGIAMKSKLETEREVNEIECDQVSGGGTPKPATPPSEPQLPPSGGFLPPNG